MNAPTEISEKERLLNKFYSFFSARGENNRKNRYYTNLKFLRKNGESIIMSGSFVGFVPDKFYGKEYLGKDVEGKDEVGSWIDIPLSDIIDLISVPK